MPENTGMLWEDNSPNEPKGKNGFYKTERDKILDAIVYYKEKYGIVATMVQINANSNFSIKKDIIEGVTVKKVNNILPGNYWVM